MNEEIQQETPSPRKEESGVRFGIPAAIIVAGVIIAGAILFIGSQGAPADTVASPDGTGPQEVSLAGITPGDHLLGDPNAPLIIVEFSDLECPFCKSFHGTMKQVMQAYGEDGTVAWVYRHFPLSSIHPKAQKEAEATECAAELGGELAFWEYTDKIFEITPSNNGLDLALLPQIAEELGLDRAAFEECLESERHKDAVTEDLNEAIRAGAQGTPFSVILTKDGKTTTIFGAQQFEKVKEIIEASLDEQ